jgi:pyruvate/2-oxoglutarate/acetoin dehydrogenase E1 component
VWPPRDDITIVATGGAVPLALRAAAVLDGEGVDVEVVDPRTLFPLDLDTILASVAKTNRLVVAHEATRFCGIGAEVAASVGAHGF